MDTETPEKPETTTGKHGGSAPDRPSPAALRPDASSALKGLTVLACLYTLVVAKDVLMPLTLALIVAFLFSPLVEWMARRRLPKPLGAALVVLSLLGTFVGGVYLLADPAKKWMAEGPTAIAQLKKKLDVSVADIEAARQQVEQIISDPGQQGGVGARRSAKPSSPPKREPITFSVIDAVASVSAIIAQFGWVVIIVMSLTYMILISEDIFKMRLVRILPRLSERKRALHIVEGVKKEVASYLATVTVINVGVGIAVGIALHVAGLPNAALWGALAAVVNYLPYIGPISGIVVIGFVSLLTFSEPSDALLPIVLYITIHGLESQVLTPAILGRRMTLNPAFVFIAILGWGWMWGVVGALIAVPMLAITKVFCDHIDSLAPVGELLSGAERPPKR